MTSPQTFSASGIPVEYSFYADHEPYILNGIFQLESQAGSPVQFSVLKVWCQSAEQSLPLDHFFVYRLPDYIEEDPKAIHQLPHETVQYEVSFPRIHAVPYLHQPVQVGVELEVAGERVTVFSPYNIHRRTQRRG